ncbi:MAG: hypothetical protein D6722_24800 [Bacteroidetes bacterium]|nr:MAG: hypothetical protein D6722_24800 [Bacteroidota bacterium]
MKDVAATCLAFHRLPFWLCLLLLLPAGLRAQPRRNCGAMDHLEQQLQADPGMAYRMRQIEQNTETVAKSAFSGVPDRIVIPVVVHVVYRNEEENISDAQVRSQIRVLNEDFLRENPDSIYTPSEFLSVAAGSGISFQLANRDPQGKPTTGITRRRTHRVAFYSSDNGVKYEAMGGVDPWPTDQYLNIWVCNLGAGVLGYGQFPGGSSETDGVVIGYKYFGTQGPVVAPFNQGRTTTHEVGHWLNLRHIWGDGNCELDDLVDDTPAADRPHHGCETGAESCGGLSMIENFMDYTDDACMNLFTRGQAERMRALFAPTGARRMLLESPGIVVEAPPVAVLPPPARVEVQGVTAQTARVSWPPVAGAEAYRARLRPVGGTQWAERTFSHTFINLTYLQACTPYELEVASVGRGADPAAVSRATFQTTGCAEPVAPTELMAQLQGPDQASLSWRDLPGATGYRLQYKRAGSREVVTRDLQDNTFVVSGLRPGGRYLFRVRAFFGEERGPYSQVESFVAGQPAFVGTHRLEAGGGDYLRLHVQGAQMTVGYDIDEPAPVVIRLLDEQGQPLRTFDPFSVQAGSPFDLDLSGLGAAVRYFSLEDADGFVHLRRLGG